MIATSPAVRLLLAAAWLLPVAHADAACVRNNVGTYECSGDLSGTTLVGTTQSDTFRFYADAVGSNIAIVSNGGTDMLDFSDNPVAVSIDIASEGPQTVRAGLSVQFLGFGGAPGTQLRGGDGADTLTGGTGDDVFVGGPGADIMTGGDGIDTRAAEAASNCAGDVLSSIEMDQCASSSAPASEPRR